MNTFIYQHNKSNPLFLHVAHNAPHVGNRGGFLQPPLYSPLKNHHIADPDRRLYAEIVNQIDCSVGRIVRALAERNDLDNTIIIFASDNGAPTIGDMSNWGVNLPFRGKKYTPWEGGVRVPAFIWHPSFRPRIWDGLMHITDWLPTITAAAGGQVKTDIDGVNQWNSIIYEGPSRRQEALIIVEEDETNSYAAYRAGDYKIILGNVTGMSNGYYGAQFLSNKRLPPEYFPSFKSCEITRILEKMGYYFDMNKVQEMRAATIMRQEDHLKDPTPCEPSAYRGCLYNVRRDPTESHNIWESDSKIAENLTKRLNALWSMRRKRGPQKLDDQADPAYHNYTWTPWLAN